MSHEQTIRHILPEKNSSEHGVGSIVISVNGFSNQFFHKTHFGKHQSLMYLLHGKHENQEFKSVKHENWHEI